MPVITFDPHTNFAYSTIMAGSSIIGSTGTPKTIVLASGDGAHFPGGDGVTQFNVVIWPPNARPLATNAEIVRVTRSSDILTTTARGQEGTAALAGIAAGYQVMNAVTAKTLTDVEGILANSGYQVINSQYGFAVSNTIVETTMYSYTVPANVVTAQRELVLRIDGTWRNGTGSAQGCARLRLKIGGTTFIDTNAMSSAVIASQANRVNWYLEARIMNLNSVTAQLVLFDFFYSTGGTDPLGSSGNPFTIGTGSQHTQGSPYPGWWGDGSNLIAVDFTLAQQIDVTVTNPNAGIYDVKMEYGRMALIGQ